MTAAADRVVTSVDDRRTAVLDVIRGARRKIVLSLFRCKDKEILAELARATARGVAVEVLVTARAKGGRRKLLKLYEALEHTGATVSLYSDAVVKYHAKYLVADDGPAIVASLNFTKRCLNWTLDALVVTYDAGVVSGLRRLMAADRERKPLPVPLSPRLIVGPELARAQLTELIDSARTRIRIVDAKLSDPDLVARLNAKRAAGVTVEVFSTKRVGGLKSHGKILLVDDRVAVIGSLALTALSLGFRREVAITVEDAAAVAEVGRFFDALLEASPGSGVASVENGGSLC